MMAFQEEEDRLQARLFRTGFWGWGRLEHGGYFLVFATSISGVIPGPDWGYQTVKWHKLMKGKKQEKDETEAERRI